MFQISLEGLIYCEYWMCIVYKRIERLSNIFVALKLEYDFPFLPWDLVRQINLGYFFVNIH